MSRYPIQAMSLEAFASLVEQVGMPIELDDFEQLIERKLLLPLEGEQEDGSPEFCLLQLFGLARYVDAVTVLHHPWLGAPEDLEGAIDEARHVTVHLTTLANRLRGEAEFVRKEELEQLVLEFERELEQSNPFGPLAVIIDFARRDVIEQLRGAARFWAEMHFCASELSRMADELARGDLAETAPMGHASVSGLASRGLRTTQDMEAVDTAALRSTLELETPEEGDAADASATAPAIKTGIKPPTSSPRVTTEMDAVERSEGEAADASAEEGEGDQEEEGANPFKRDASQSTSSNSDLQHRLEALRNLDGRRARASSIGAKAIALAQAKAEAEADDDVEEEGAVPESAQVFDEETVAREVSPDALAETVGEGEEEDAAAPDGEEDGEDKNIFAVEENTFILDNEIEGEDEDAGEGGEESDSSGNNDDGGDDGDELVSEQAQEPESAPDPRPEEQADHASMAEKIQELNQKREAYMREQNWEGLLALYEDGITLFEAQERQQVHLTLAKLYELKLQDSARAFENMTAAFSLGGPRAIQEKIIEAMQRSGGGGAQKESYLAWLEEQAGATDLAPDSMELLQMTWSRHLRAEDPQRAFFSFASYLADNPEERASESTLAFFEELGEGVENEELYALYDDLLEQVRRGETLALIGEKAGMHALENAGNALALGYLSKAYAADPSREQCYHILAQLYEEEERWSELALLHERRAVYDPSQAEAMADALRDARARELESPDDSIAFFTEHLDANPGDTIARDRLLHIFMHHSRHAEAYAFLNRHIEQLESPEQRARLLQSMATIAQKHLYAPEEAVVHLEEALRLGGEDRGVLEGLIALQIELQQWPHVIKAIERLTGSFELENSQRITMLMKGAQAARHGADPEAERRFLEHVLALEPAHTQANAALAELAN